MKTALKAAIVVLFFALLLVAILFKLFYSNPDEENVPQQSPQFPVSSNITSQDQTLPEVQDVQRAFLNNIDNADQITLGTAAIISTFALQNWSDENKGGQALLQIDQVTSEWEIVSLGGGAWELDSLVAAGVPENIAVQLLQ